MSTTFDDIPFGVETGRAASYTDWQIETRDRSEMVPYSNILITEHIGYAPAQVTWRLHFYRRADYFAFLAKLRTVGTLKVYAGLQSLKGTQVTLGNPPRVYDVLDNVKVAMNQYYSYNLFSALLRTGKYWGSEAENDAKARELLEIFNLQDKADFVAENLPYGQQRKLEIARALATGMKLLLLDEPAAGMNPTETAELLECIRIIRQRFNISILLIEHDMSLVMKICEQIIVIDYGTTIARGTPEEISSNPRVIAAYLGEED